MSKIFKIAAVGWALSLLSAGQALAVPLFQSTIDATLSLTGVSVAEGTGDADVEVFGETVLIDSDSFADGDASSNHSAALSPAFPTSMTVAPVSVQLNATGESPGIGSADAFGIADSIITMFNNSTTNTVKLDFVLEYSLTALASVEDAFLQYATATTYFSVQNSQASDPVLEFDWVADTETPDTDFSVSDVLSFSIFITPENEASLFILSDVSGFVLSEIERSTSTVPIPSMAGLFTVAAFMGLRRRRKQA